MQQNKITLLILSLNFPSINEKNQYILKEGGGGAQNQILLLVKNLIKTDKFRVYVLSKRFNLKELSRIKIKNLNLIKIYAPNRFFLLYFWLSSFLIFLNIHRKEKVNLIHINTPSIFLPIAYFIKKLFNIPIFQKFPSIFTKSLFSNKYYRLAQPFFLQLSKNFNKIQCLSTQIYNNTIKLGFKSEHLVKIPNGINTQPYLKIIRDLDKKIRKILFIGRFVQEKGVLFLIKAFAEVVLHHSNISLSLFGKGPERNKIIRLIRKLNLEEKIFISSFNSEDEKLKILQEHDLFILPSFFEGMSNALLEALCSGMPILVSDIKSNKEFIKNRYNGLLFKKGNKISLQDKIIYCLDNSKQLWEIGLNGREYCKNHFDINIIQNKIFRIYVNLIKNGR